MDGYQRVFDLLYKYGVNDALAVARSEGWKEEAALLERVRVAAARERRLQPIDHPQVHRMTPVTARREFPVGVARRREKRRLESD